MGDIIQSAGGIVYFTDSKNEPKYLIIKRHALSGKIERVAPKGKIEKGEEIENTALREVSEETGIPLNQMKIKQKVGMTSLRSTETKRGQIDKDVTYFLIEYTGAQTDVSIAAVEGYVGTYKRANIQEILGLIYYEDIRELFRKSYGMIKEQRKNLDIKQNFLDKLKL